MRCPNCSFEIQGNPRLCPKCNDTLPAPEAWEAKTDARPWVNIGSVCVILVLLLAVLSRWPGTVGVGACVLLIALALFSRFISRGRPAEAICLPCRKSSVAWEPGL